MKKNDVITIVSIIIGILAVLGAIATTLYVLDKKGILKLKRTNYKYEEEFPDEELPA